MHKLLGLSAALVCTACAHTLPETARTTPGSGANWTPRLDADLSGWDTYLSYRFTPDYDGTKAGY